MHVSRRRQLSDLVVLHSQRDRQDVHGYYLRSHKLFQPMRSDIGIVMAVVNVWTGQGAEDLGGTVITTNESREEEGCTR